MMPIEGNFQVVDLTHPLSSKIPTWDGSCGFHLETAKDYDQMFRVQKIQAQAGIGTHMDAPSHKIPGGASIADLPIEHFIVPISLLNLSKKANPDYEVTVQDIEEYEEEFGAILPNSLVIAATGWSRFWDNPKAYRNADSQGRLHFPAFSPEAAQFLLKRNIAGIAIDTLSPDCSRPTFPVHQILLGAGKYVIENVADCSRISPKGSYAIALPLRLEHGTESPIRLAALVPK